MGTITAPISMVARSETAHSGRFSLRIATRSPLTMPSTVRFHRVLRAPAQRVYRAFLDGDAMVKWLPPNGFTGRVHEMDPRVGGTYKMSFTNFTSGKSHSFGGEYLVHGSPAQRETSGDPGARARGEAAWAAIAEEAKAARVTYCIEPLAPSETRLINTVEEAAALVRAIGSPAVRTMIDSCAAGNAERFAIPELFELA